MRYSIIRVVVITMAMVGVTSLGVWVIGDKDTWVVQVTLVVGFILGFFFGRTDRIRVVNEAIQEVVDERTRRS